MPINRDAPAGISNGGGPHGTRKRLGQNVERFIQREEELVQARVYTQLNATNANRARWEEKQNLAAANGARSQQQKQLEDELSLMNKEVLLIRHDRLKKYYETCYEEWEQELRAKGLALIRDRD